MVLGFYIRDENDYVDFCAAANRVRLNLKKSAEWVCGVVALQNIYELTKCCTDGL